MEGQLEKSKKERKEYKIGSVENLASSNEPIEKKKKRNSCIDLINTDEHNSSEYELETHAEKSSSASTSKKKKHAKHDKILDSEKFSIACDTETNDGSFSVKKVKKHHRNEKIKTSEHVHTKKKEKTMDSYESEKLDERIKESDSSESDDSEILIPSQTNHVNTQESTEVFDDVRCTNKLTTRDDINSENSSDSEDHSSIKSIHDELENESVQKNNFSKINSLDSLKYLQVEVDFEVPKLHLILSGTRYHTPEQKAHVARLQLPYRVSKKFTKIEDNQIRKNWNDFIEKYNIANCPKLFMNILNLRKINSTLTKGFLLYLSRDLLDRSPKSVYARFKLLMSSNVKHGKFDDDEDRILKQHIKENKDKGSIKKLAQKLNRTFASIDKKIERVKNSYERRIKWNAGNLETYLKYLILVTGVDDIMELKNRHITNKEFSELAKHLDDIPTRIVRNAWFGNIYTRLFIPEEIVDVSVVRFDLISLMYNNKEDDLKAVDWKKYTKLFEGFTSVRLSNLLTNMIVLHVKKEYRNNFQNCLEVLHTLKKERMKKSFIYKVIYEDGKVTDLKKIHAPNKQTWKL